MEDDNKDVSSPPSVEPVWQEGAETFSDVSVWRSIAKVSTEGGREEETECLFTGKTQIVTGMEREGRHKQRANGSTGHRLSTATFTCDFWFVYTISSPLPPLPPSLPHWGVEASHKRSNPFVRLPNTNSLPHFHSFSSQRPNWPQQGEQIQTRRFSKVFFFLFLVFLSSNHRGGPASV